MGLEEQLRMLGRVALAMLLGAIIGFERELEDKPAGLRTHMEELTHITHDAMQMPTQFQR